MDNFDEHKSYFYHLKIDFWPDCFFVRSLFIESVYPLVWYCSRARSSFGSIYVHNQMVLFRENDVLWGS